MTERTGIRPDAAEGNLKSMKKIKYSRWSGTLNSLAKERAKELREVCRGWRDGSPVKHTYRSYRRTGFVSQPAQDGLQTITQNLRIQ